MVTVMSNHYVVPFIVQQQFADVQDRVQAWMLAQMAQYPPPPQPDQQHYNALYPNPAGTQQLLDPQDELQYSNLNQSVYPKQDPDLADQSSSHQHMHALAQELQNQAALEDRQRQRVAPNVQHLQHQMTQPLTPSSHGHASQQQQQQQPPPNSQSASDAQKANRLRKACDSCSIRKVKCDESGPPCRACAALEIPCTFERPSRRRGPPNRHAEAIKRRRLDDPMGSPLMSNLSAPSSPTHAAQALAALSSHPSSQHLSAESICPIETLDLLIDDFFIYIHPLCPFPHEPSFREAWKRREDLTNTSFLALLASMMGALVSSFPRKPRLHLKAQRRENLFPNHMSLISRCQKVCTVARGSGYLESEGLSVYDAATSYFLGLTGMYTFRWRQGRLYFGECLTIIRTLGLHKSIEQTYTRLGSLPSTLGLPGVDHEGSRGQGVDNITLEVGRRIFWTMFVSAKGIHQSGAAFSELIVPPPTPSDPYPPLPAEVDDFCIYPTHNEPQPAGLLPIVSGFNANVRVYNSYNSLSTMELAWGIDAVVDWDRQARVLHECLRLCKSSLSELPPELTVYPSSHPDARPHFAKPPMPKDPAASLMSPAQRTQADTQTPEQRRQMQQEIQKANIYASCLATRLYVVEKYWNLCEARDRATSHPSSPSAGVTAAGLEGLLPPPPPPAPTSNPDPIEQEMRQEREAIVQDLLIVLSNIDEVNMEPNADSFTMKIRSIASTLLDAPDARKGALAIGAQEYLSAFLTTLMRLERVNPATSSAAENGLGVSAAVEDEEVELRVWADLREAQMKFAQQGGLLGVA